MSNFSYPTVITYYTPQWEYESYAMCLKQNCKELDVPFYCKKYETLGSWVADTTIKPNFILEALEYLKRPVLWIDADGSLWKAPDYFLNFTNDFAAKRYRNEWRYWQVGTLFFNYTEPSLELLNSWCSISNLKRGTDENAFDLAWKDRPRNLTFSELPNSYFEMFSSLTQKPKPDTVISHRASKSESKLKSKLKS